MEKLAYQYDIDLNSHHAPAYVVNMVGQNKKVLELGPGPGSISKKLKEADCKVTAVEINPEFVEHCQPFCEQVILSDIDSLDWLKQLDSKFDVIVLADVLEHLKSPETILEHCRTLLNDTGYLVISLPNATHLSLIAALINNRFPYQEAGLLDKTHIKFFSRKDIETLLLANGFLGQFWQPVTVPPEHSELAFYWNSLPIDVQRSLKSINTDGLIYQYVIKAFASSDAGTITALHQTVNDLEVKLNSQKKINVELTEKLSNLTTANEQKQTALNHLEKETGRMQEKIHLVEKTASDYQIQISELKQKHHNILEDTMNAFEQSTSWKITAPLRALIKIFKA